MFPLHARPFEQDPKDGKMQAEQPQKEREANHHERADAEEHRERAEAHAYNGGP